MCICGKSIWSGIQGFDSRLVEYVQVRWTPTQASIPGSEGVVKSKPVQDA